MFVNVFYSFPDEAIRYVAEIGNGLLMSWRRSHLFLIMMQLFVSFSNYAIEMLIEDRASIYLSTRQLSPFMEYVLP